MIEWAPQPWMLDVLMVGVIILMVLCIIALLLCIIDMIRGPW